MNKKLLTFLSLTSLLLQASSRDADRGSCCPTNTFQNLVVTNNITAGSETVRGAVTASSFVLSSGDTLFNGLRNWAVLSNQGEVIDTAPVLWDATPAGNTSPGITFSPLNGVIILPTSPAGTGLFLVQYTVRFTAQGFGTGTGTAQLQQGPSPFGPFVDILQPVVISTTDTFDSFDIIQLQLTGYALIRASAGSNAIQLVIGLTGTGGDMTLPATDGTDANAEITILQLN